MKCHNCNERIDRLDLKQQQNNKFGYCSDECKREHTKTLQVRKSGNYRVNTGVVNKPKRRVIIKIGEYDG